MADAGSIERNHEIHSRALGRPSQSGVAEHSTDSIMGAARSGFAVGAKLAEGQVAGVSDVSQIRKELASAEPEPEVTK